MILGGIVNEGVVMAFGTMFGRRFIGAAAVGLLALVGTGVAWGAGAFTSSIPSNGTLTACYPTAGSLKAMYLIDPATTPTCPNGFTMVTFNQQGQQGPTGVTGPSGPSGASGPSGGSGPTGPTGPTGVTGVSGATGPSGPGVAGTQVVSNQFGPLAANTYYDVSSPDCPAGTHLTGGGYWANGPYDLTDIYIDGPIDPSTPTEAEQHWTLGFISSSDVYAASTSLYVYAVCAQ